MKVIINKKVSASLIVAAVTFVFALLAVILYGANVASVGYFQGQAIAGVVAPAVCAVILACLVVCGNVLQLDGIVGKIVKFVVDVLKILIPVLAVLAVLTLANGRAQGLGFLFFSNDEIKEVMLTPENVASANVCIASFVFFGLAIVSGIVSAFMSIRKAK